MDDSTAGAQLVLMWILLLILLAVIPAVIAAKKGRSPVKWYLYGFCLWIFALIHAIMLPPARRCPFCAEGIRPEARVCPHCQRDLVGAVIAPSKRAGLMLDGL